MKPPERLETRRLILRRARLMDAAEIFHRYAGDACVTRFLGWPQHRSVDDTRAFLEFSETQWRDCPPGAYLIERKAGPLIGSTGLEVRDAHEAATGYVLARDAWGQGYATEALEAMIDVARELGIRNLYALCHREHVASRHVLEKCRFKRSAELLVNFPNLSPADSANALRYELVLT